MERRCERDGETLAPPEGLDGFAVRRALDRERLAESYPDIPRERLARIARIRDEMRRGVYETPERLEIAVLGAVADARRPRRRT